MGKINLGRVVLGGLVAGIVINVFEFVLNGVVGSGPMTAIFAALLTWITSYVLVDAMPTIMGVIPMSMTLMLVGVGLIEILVATLAGAYLYKET